MNMRQKKTDSALWVVLLLILGACSPTLQPGAGLRDSASLATSRTKEPNDPSGTVDPPAHSSCGDPFDGSGGNFPLSFWIGRTDFCQHSVPFSEISNGNPRPDGIPAIDNPVFESISDGDEWLGEDWPVMLFEWQGEVRAYPLAILIWHEIVNDVVGGEPVTLTFCPLCNATLAFRRTLPGGLVLDFGTTGNLRNSDLVMYDRQTFSWWQQFTGESIVGELTGTTLDVLPSQIVAWGDFKASNPDGLVLSRQTGAVRDYGSNPYPGYDSISNSPFFPVEIGDDRLAPMERVVALELDGSYVAYPFSELRKSPVVNDEVAGQPVVIFWKPGTISTFGNNGPDTGSTGAFSSLVEDRALSFISKGDMFEDRETGSTWNLLGEAVKGPMAGKTLDRLPAGEHFWFAWVAFVPETRVWRGE
jgi:hypothetical protein